MYPKFSEYELTVALSILMQGKKPVVTIGLNDRPVRGEAGLTCIPDTTIDQANQAEIDSLLLTGCMDVLALQNEADLIEFIRKTGSNASVIASISSSPFLLAKAGLLQGKKYTIGMTEENRKKTGVFEAENYSGEPVVRDGNLITATGRNFIQFGTVLGQALNLSFDGQWYKGRAL